MVWVALRRLRRVWSFEVRGEVEVSVFEAAVAVGVAPMLRIRR